MSNQELKDRLHRQIEAANNDELLKLVSELLGGNYPLEGKYVLTEQEETILSQRDIVKEPGNDYTTEQIQERLKKSLGTKQRLIELIENLDNNELLEKALVWFQQSTNNNFQATPGEIKAIRESLESVKQYGTISQEEATARLKAKFPNLSF